MSNPIPNNLLQALFTQSNSGQQNLPFNPAGIFQTASSDGHSAGSSFLQIIGNALANGQNGSFNGEEIKEILQSFNFPESIKAEDNLDLDGKELPLFETKTSQSTDLINEFSIQLTGDQLLEFGLNPAVSDAQLKPNSSVLQLESLLSDLNLELKGSVESLNARLSSPTLEKTGVVFNSRAKTGEQLNLDIFARNQTPESLVALSQFGLKDKLNQQIGLTSSVVDAKVDLNPTPRLVDKLSLETAGSNINSVNFKTLSEAELKELMVALGAGNREPLKGTIEISQMIERNSNGKLDMQADPLKLNQSIDQGRNEKVNVGIFSLDDNEPSSSEIKAEIKPFLKQKNQSTDKAELGWKSELPVRALERQITSSNLNSLKLDNNPLQASYLARSNAQAITDFDSNMALVAKTESLDGVERLKNELAVTDLSKGLNLKQNFAPNLALRIQWMFKQAMSSAEIMMDPPEMGPLSVKIKHTNGEANIMFQVSHAATKDVLEENLSKLRDMLQQQGINLGEALVQQHDRNARNEQNDPNFEGNSAMDQLFEEEVEMPEQHITSVEQILDVYS